MATRVVEGKKPYTGGDAIDINQNKVISLKLRDENNLIIYDSGDDEIYVDLQLADGIEPTDAFPVGVTTGRVLVADEWDKTGTLICAKTTSGDNIKLLYADDGTLWIDNGTGTFKQIYLSTDIATILTDYATKEYVDAHDTIISSTEPEDPYEGMIWYNTGTDKLKVYNGASWQDIGSGGGGSSYTAGYGIEIDANDEISVDTSEIATQSDLSSKQDELVSGTNIKTINNESLLGSGDITISGGGADIEYKTQAEYDALPSSKLTDGKHYVIYTADTPTPPTPWQPGANTIAYYPLTDDFSDYSLNSYNLTQNNTNITTIDGVKCCDLNNSYASANFVVSTLPYTICFWAKAKNNGGAGCFGLTFADNGSWGGSGMGCRNANKILIRFGNPTDHSGGDIQIDTSIDTNWHLRIGTFSSSGFILYKDGTQAGTYGTSLHDPINSGTPLRIGANEAGTTEYSNGYMGGVIIEDKARTSQEVVDYYDLTKGDYGIS